MSEDKKPEEGKYWYTDTEFPGMKVRMDGIREFVIDENLGLSDAQIERLMNGVGYWFLKRSSIMFPPTAASPVSDAVDMELVKGCVKRLSDLKKYHINPYNLGEQGEVGSLITTLAQIFKLPPPSSPTSTNVQEQDEGTREVWVDIAATFLTHISVTGSTDDAIAELKSKYTITKKQ